MIGYYDRPLNTIICPDKIGCHDIQIETYFVLRVFMIK